MYRYCTKCQKNIDFDIKSMEQLDELVCPECGSKIDKNSRQPRNVLQEEKMEIAIGRGINGLMWLGFVIYILVATVGIIAFCLRLDIFLYIITAIGMVTFLVKYGRGTSFIDSGILWVVLGAVFGFFLYRSVPGICFGINAGIIIRQVIKYLIMGLLFRVLRRLSR